MNSTLKLSDTSAASNDAAVGDALIAAIDRYYAGTSLIKNSHAPVPLELIQGEETPDVTLYLASTDEANRPSFKIFREEGLYLSAAEVEALGDNGVKNVYIARADVPAFTQYVEKLLISLPTTSPMASPLPPDHSSPHHVPSPRSHTARVASPTAPPPPSPSD